MKAATLILAGLAIATSGCATEREPEIIHRSRIIRHPATGNIPEWTTEILTERVTAHDTLHHRGEVIPGIPKDQ